MERTPDATVVLERVGAGLIAGAVAVFVLAALLLPEIAALLVIGLGLLAYALEHQRDKPRGVAAGLVLAAILPVIDRQLDPIGASLVRSTLATVVIGVGLAVGAILIDLYGDRVFGREP